MRISARLDEDRSHKLDYLIRATHERTSEVVKKAIDVLYEQVRSSQPKAVDVLKRTGFVACSEADPDLSRRYKEDLGKLIEAKHGHR